MIARILTFLRQMRCRHVREEFTDSGELFQREGTVDVSSHLVTGPWRTEPHPVPALRKKFLIQRQPVAALSCCRQCGKLSIVRGHNQRDLPADKKN